jgi:hypothetical protein
MKYSPAVAALLLIPAGCGSRSAPHDLASCVPPETVAAAGLDLDRIRAAPAYTKLPQSVVTLAGSYRDAHRILVAWSGTDLLIVVQGTAPGATTVAPNLAVTGSTESVRAAVAQCRTGQPGAPALLDFAKKTAGSAELWIAVQGGITLPLTGNSRNLNRLFRDQEYASLAAHLNAAIDLRITAQGRDDRAARQFEESLRAFLSLAAASENRNPSLAALVNSTQIHRDGPITTATLAIPPEAVETFLGTAGRTF